MPDPTTLIQRHRTLCKRVHEDTWAYALDLTPLKSFQKAQCSRCERFWFETCFQDAVLDAVETARTLLGGQRVHLLGVSPQPAATDTYLALSNDGCLAADVSKSLDHEPDEDSLRSVDLALQTEQCALYAGLGAALAHDVSGSVQGLLVIEQIRP